MDAPMKKRMVVSAVNFTEGGPLTVLRDCLEAAVANLGGAWEVIALVHDRSILAIPGVTFLEFPKAKKNWFLRLYYEWFYFYGLSLKLRADLWLSLHDVTPRVKAGRRVVYCHNPSPFYRISLQEAWLDKKFFLFNSFYLYLYGAGIQNNNLVVVQQEWLRREFEQKFGMRNVVVAYPKVHSVKKLDCQRDPVKPFRFLYPSLPRVFKNFEVVCEGARLLNSTIKGQFKVVLTLDGTENAYSAKLVDAFRSEPGIEFVGRLNRDQMLEQYSLCDCVVFPSKLETWGLAITEAKAFGIPVLAADLPYAHETVGNCDDAEFFPACDPEALASRMAGMMEQGRKPNSVAIPEPRPPFASDWDRLLEILTCGL